MTALEHSNQRKVKCTVQEESSVTDIQLRRLRKCAFTSSRVHASWTHSLYFNVQSISKTWFACNSCRIRHFELIPSYSVCWAGVLLNSFSHLLTQCGTNSVSHSSFPTSPRRMKEVALTIHACLYTHSTYVHIYTCTSLALSAPYLPCLLLSHNRKRKYLIRLGR